ncbi:MAG: ATP-binding protein [Frankiaceae bacterium]
MADPMADPMAHPMAHPMAGGPVARPVVGRAAEIATLHQALAQAGAAEGGLVLITGEAGIGKTFLARAALREPPVACSVLWGTCRDDPGVPGLWPWVEVLRAAAETGLLPAAEASELEGLIGAPAGPGTEVAGSAAGKQAPGGQEVRRFHMFDNVARALRRAAAVRPLVVVLDDVHWADAGTLRLLRFLQPDLPRSRMLVVAAYRADEVGGDSVQLVLDELAARSLVLPLRGLDVDGVAQLLGPTGAPGSGAARDDAAAVLVRTGGNPFLVQQVMRLSEGAAGLPAGVREVLGRRLARLPAECVRLLEVAAVAGREVSVAIVARAADVPAEQVWPALVPAVSAGVVGHTDPFTVRFSHDLFREALSAAIDPTARAAANGRVADALEAVLPPGIRGRAGEIARHRVLAPPGHPGDVVGSLRAAAEEATANLAFEEAAEHLVVAARMAGLAGDTLLHRQLVLDLGDAQRRAGDLVPACESYRDAAQAASDDAGTLARAALGLHQVGAATWSSHADVIALLRQAIAARAEQDATTARLLAALARELAHGPGARSEALAVSSRAVALAGRIGDPAVLAIGLQARHDALWAPGSARQRLDVLADMQRAAAAAADPVMAWEALFGQFVALLELGDFEAYSVFFQVVEATDRLGQPHYRWVMQSRRAVLAIFAGRLEAAEALLPQIAETGQLLGEPDGMNVVGDLMWQLAALRGTRRMLRDSWAAVADTIPPMMRARVEGLAALEDGDPASGLAAVRPWVESALDGVRGWQVLGNAAMLAELAAAAGDEALCRRLYDRLAPHAGEIVVTGGAANVAGPVSLYLGLIASRLGRRTDAVAHLRHAVEASERLDARPWAARARHELACLPRDKPTSAGSPAGNAFTCQQDVWTLAFAGSVVRMRDAKGLRDIAQLLAAPGRDVPATALLGAGLLGAGFEQDTAMGADTVLDEQAVRTYRRRLESLQVELDAADATGDVARSARVQSERDALVAALARARGLGGRPRRLGDAGERARKAVTARIRDSLNRIQARHPALGEHLRQSIVTGTCCAYRPVSDVHWQL